MMGDGMKKIMEMTTSHPSFIEQSGNKLSEDGI
jgi:hypothetical protein